MALQLKKIPEKWFDLTTDEPKARVLIAALTPADRRDIEAVSIKPNVEVRGYMTTAAEMTAKPDIQFEKGKALEIERRVKGLENILGIDGKPLFCTPENVQMLRDNVPGFDAFVVAKGAEVDALVETQIKLAEKN